MKPMPEDLLVSLEELLNSGRVVVADEDTDAMEDEVETAMKALGW